MKISLELSEMQAAELSALLLRLRDQGEKLADEVVQISRTLTNATVVIQTIRDNNLPCRITTDQEESFTLRSEESLW